MTTTAHEDQHLAAPEPVRQPYDTVAILRRNIADAKKEMQRQAERAESYADALRSLASYVGAGGYNADTVDAGVFEDKIRWGIGEIVMALTWEVRRLREENERLRKDAGRYQWLRELVSSKDGTIQAQGLFWNCSHSRRKLDAALDAARSAKTLPEPAP